MRKINVILSLLVVTLLMVWAVQLVSAQTPEEYAYVIPLDFENLSGSDIDHLLPIEVNALALVNLGVVSTATDDYLWTDPNEIQVQGFAQDLDANGVRWWSHVNVPSGSQTTNFVFVGGPDVDDGFPVNRPSRNDAHIEIPDSASLDVADDLDIRVQAEFETADDMCGVLVDKTDGTSVDTSKGFTGYALYSFGNFDNIAIMPVAGFSNSTNMYWDFTPNEDMYLCGLHQSHASVGVVTQARIVKGDLLNDLAFDTVTTFPLRHNYSGNAYLNYFDHAVLLEGGIKHRFYMTLDIAQATSNTTVSGATSIGTYSTSGALTHTTYGSFRTPAGSYSGQLALSYILAASPITTIQGRIDDQMIRGNNEVWNGTNDAVLRLTYSSPTIDLYVDALNVGAGVLVQNDIGINAENVVIGRYFDGHIKSIDIQASSTSVLNIPDFMPNRISEFQEGELANSWLWKGTITDDSASANDAVYFITADTTNVNIEAGPLALQPTPTPAQTPEVLAGLLAGGSVGGLHTPVPTVDPELPGTPDPPDPEHMQSEVFYSILGLWAFTFIIAIFGAWLSEYIMAIIFTAGFGMIAAYAGADFNMWNVSLIALGSVGLAFILHQGR